MNITFKKGDKVRLISDNSCIDKAKLGDIVIITEVNEYGTITEIAQYGSGWGYVNAWFELVKDTPKPKFKIGDRVRTLNKTMGDNDLRASISRRLGSNEGILNDIRSDCYVVDGDFFNVSDLELVEEGCNSCEVNSDNVGEMLGRAKEVLNRGLIGELQGYSYYNAFNEPSNSSGNKVGKIMSKVSEFVKNSLLSKEEKLLRKYGLKDSCGDYTDEAERLVIGKLVKENEAYLIEVATAMEVEEKKNK